MLLTLFNILPSIVARAVVLSTGPVSDHTQCKFRSVSNNSQQDQCDTVWSTTRRNIHCEDHTICAFERWRSKEVNFQLVEMLSKPNSNVVNLHLTMYSCIQVSWHCLKHTAFCIHCKCGTYLIRYDLQYSRNYRFTCFLLCVRNVQLLFMQ